MEEQLLAVIVRSLPVLVSLVFSIFNFNRSLVVLGIKANEGLCSTFSEQEAIEFPCVGPGTNALSIASAAISLATSLIIAAILTTLSFLRALYGIWALLLFGGIFAFVVSYKEEIFKVEDALMESNHQFWAKHICLGANLIGVSCSIIFSVISVLLPVWMPS